MLGDATVNSVNSVFLETTVQADRITLSPERRRLIESALANCRLVTSTYVLGEFKQTFLYDTVLFHKLLISSPSIQEALNRFEQQYGRKQGRLFRIFTRLSEDGIGKEGLLSRLERFIDWQLIDRFWNGIQDHTDETGCQRAVVLPVRTHDIYSFPIRCRQKPAPTCRVKDFVQKHIKEFELIADKLECDNADSTAVRNAIISILQGKPPYGNICRAIADLIITLEVPTDTKLATTNTRHYQPFNKILGGPKLVNPVPLKAE